MANFTALKTAINNAIKTNGNEEITGAILQAILDAMVETLGDSAINDLENAITTEVTNRENAVGGVADDLAAEVLARANKDNQLDGRINQEEYNRQNADAALSQTMSQGFQTLGSQMTALNAAISALNAAYQNGYLYGGIATPSSSPSNNKCFYIALQGGIYTNFGGVGVVEGINIIKNDRGWRVEHIYDQTTLLNEFYLLRQQVIQAITSFDPIVIEGDVTNAPDEEDLTSNANHLLQFKNNAYSPLEFSGLGRKYLRKNIAPLSESAPFNGFVEGVTAEETLSGTPTQIFWDRMNTRFVGIKDGVYYLDWTDSDNYVPVSTSLVYMYNGTPYQWTGSDFIVDETEVPNLVNCLTQDMINEANTIYIIRYDYTLKENITIPANCVLQFDGGSISGEHTITGANTGIQADLVKIFSTDVTLVGSWNVVESYPEWFGAIGDGMVDSTAFIQKTISTFTNIIFSNGVYLFSSQIEIGSDKTLKGCYEINNNGLVILKTTSNITCLKILGNNVTIENLTIEHPETNTVPVIDFTGYRYFVLRNVVLDHHSVHCPAIGLYCGDTSWTGYDNFVNCYISDYSENVRIENGTFVSFYNCKLNCGNETVRSLFFGGSVYCVINCDITKSVSSTSIGVEYTGRYTIDFIGCYLEGFYKESFAKITNNTYGAGVNISGSRAFINTTGGNNAYYIYSISDRYFEPTMLPHFCDGKHSTVNHVINGCFELGFVKWTIPSEITPSTVVTPSELPDGCRSCGKFESSTNSGEIYQIIGKLSKGRHTLCYWIKTEGASSSYDMDVMVSQGTAGSAYVVSRRRERASGAYSDWVLEIVTFEIPEEKADVTWYLRFYYSGIPLLYLSNISIYKGVYTEYDGGNTCSENNVITKELIVKGEDNKFYKLSVNAGVISATEVS